MRIIYPCEEEYPTNTNDFLQASLKINTIYVVDPGPFPEFTNWKHDQDPAPKVCKLILENFKN